MQVRDKQLAYQTKANIYAYRRLAMIHAAYHNKHNEQATAIIKNVIKKGHAGIPRHKIDSINPRAKSHRRYHKNNVTRSPRQTSSINDYAPWTLILVSGYPFAFLRSRKQLRRNRTIRERDKNNTGIDHNPVSYSSHFVENPWISFMQKMCVRDRRSKREADDGSSSSSC
ncbi:hypothetical protein CEXT_720321 [Caerostris extrusa]|uniref:Ribosomal protein S7 n=1 Tax=Caerostris extrusa TaxID=172846 RepID=A0AAV4SIE7_CAEEX|nr:hypothetical protein CEXT_720321 [Caerostris extrusa]